MARRPVTRTRRPAAREGGFTFIELLVALAILAFAFTYGVLRLDGATAGARLASAGRQVGCSVEFLRGHAIHAARPVEMEIDIEHRRYRSVLPPRPSETEAEREDGEASIVTEWVSLPKWVRFEGIQVGDDDSITTGIVTVTFSPLGEVSPNGFMIRLVSDEIANPDESAFSVEVNGLTGQVDYMQGRAEFEQVIDGASFL